MTRIVVKDRRFGSTMRARYTLDITVDYTQIPNNLPITDNVLRQYKETKSAIGYATFRGLNLDDIKSILSATKRQEAHLNVNRMGHCAYYKLHISGTKNNKEV